MGKYSKLQAMIAADVEELLPGGGNKELYLDMFATFSDKDFERFMDNLSFENTFRLMAPNLADPKKKIKLDYIKTVAKKYNHDFWDNLIITDPETKQVIETPAKYLTLMTMLRRQLQHISKKLAVAKDSNHTDILTGQAVGVSKAGAMSAPEARILRGKELIKVLEEVYITRGGDAGAKRYYENAMFTTGACSLNDALTAATGVRSTKSLSNYLKGMGLDTTYGK